MYKIRSIPVPPKQDKLSPAQEQPKQNSKTVAPVMGE